MDYDKGGRFDIFTRLGMEISYSAVDIFKHGSLMAPMSLKNANNVAMGIIVLGALLSCSPPVSPLYRFQDGTWV